jgi:hypothetical protein
VSHSIISRSKRSPYFSRLGNGMLSSPPDVLIANPSFEPVRFRTSPRQLPEFIRSLGVTFINDNYKPPGTSPVPQRRGSVACSPISGGISQHRGLVGRSEVNSNCQYRFPNNQTTT